jgi:hypothetical protein
MSNKPFKETKVGKLLSKVGDILPESGVLGVLKDVIDTDEELTAEEKKSAQEHLERLYESQVADRDSARNRQIELAKTGQSDWLFYLTGVVGLGAFSFAIYAIVYEPSTRENDLFIHLLGLLEGIVVSNIFAYYFGTSIDKK